MIVDSEKVEDLIRTVALDCILPRFRNLSASQIREKALNQLVTEADILAEHALTEELPRILDGAVVGEEGVDLCPGSLDVLEKSRVVWVVDPVDGTGNFARGNPRFAVIVALLIEGVTHAGWILDPVADRMFIAHKGQGAWQKNQRLKVREPVPLKEMVGSAKRSGSVRHAVAKVSRLGSAAHDYLDLVTGVTHFCHFGGKLMPWDHAAGILLHKEAGGTSGLIEGGDYSPVYQHRLGGQILLAPDRVSWQELSSFFL